MDPTPTNPAEAGWSPILLGFAGGCLCLTALFGVAPLQDRYVLAGVPAVTGVVAAVLSYRARGRVPAGVGPEERSGL